MSVQAVTIVTTAFKHLGVYASGETPSAADAADGFAGLNTFVDFLATKRLTMNGLQLFSLAAIGSGHNPYTIGVGGDFNQVRPTFIDDVTLTLAGTTPTTIPVAQINQDQWANLAAKTVSAQIATNWYYNATYDQSTPLGGLYFWPVLSDTTVTVNFWAPVAITSFATPTTSYTLLPAWQLMLETNLAVYLGGIMGVEVPPMVGRLASDAMAAIKAVNTEPGLLNADGGLLKTGSQQGFGNWLTGP